MRHQPRLWQHGQVPMQTDFGITWVPREHVEIMKRYYGAKELGKELAEAKEEPVCVCSSTPRTGRRVIIKRKEAA